MESEVVEICFTYDETNTYYAERIIMSLETAKLRYFTDNQTYKYENKLQGFVQNYNHRPYSSLNEKCPTDITMENFDMMPKELYMRNIKPSVKFEAKRKQIKRIMFKRGILYAYLIWEMCSIETIKRNGRN